MAQKPSASKKKNAASSRRWPKTTWGTAIVITLAAIVVIILMYWIVNGFRFPIIESISGNKCEGPACATERLTTSRQEAEKKYGFDCKNLTETTANMQIEVNGRQTTPDEMCDWVAKPIIYLYPTEKSIVNVTVSHPEKLTHTYPKYEQGWRVTAQPNGNLTNAHGRSYYALYWEGQPDESVRVRHDGFVIRGTDTIQFLEEKLAQLGLNEREANEFIIYWLPRMENNPYNYVRFETEEEIENYMKLDISPKPDSVVRVMMTFKPLKEPIDVTEQELQAPKRHGFVVVEWGGTEIP